MPVLGPETYCAIVVTFRRPESLADVIDSLAAQTVHPSVVVVADNDPHRSAEPVVTDDRWGRLDLLYLPLDENAGPAGGWARAAAAVEGRADRGSWLLVVDDDDPLGHPELVERLLEAASAVDRPERCGAIGLRGATLDRRRALLTRAQPAEGTAVRVDYLASNGAPMYRWAAVDQVGFFDGGLFFGFEDLDEGLRLAAAGWDLWCLPLPSLHEVADTASNRTPWREYFKVRALVSIVRRHLGARALATAIVRSALLGGIRLAVQERDWRFAEARLAGAVDGLRGRSGPNGRAPQTNEPKAMRRGHDGLDLLFVSGVSVGGARRSTLELADALQERGHQVRVVLGDRPASGTPWDLVLRAVTKLRPLPGGAVAHRLFRRVTRGLVGRGTGVGASVITARFPENAYLDVVERRRPDAVIANSLSRTALHLVHGDLRSRSIPLVLYLREAQALNHLEVWGIRPDLVIANSHALAERSRAAGVPCTVVPSAVDVRTVVTTSTRSVLLMVNPVPENRPWLAVEVARARPDIAVVLQESWPLEPEQRADLIADAAGLANVEVRATTGSPAEIYRDARLLLAPYPTGRPRVVVEAQHNEIPTVALDQPGLREVVGKAGVLVSADAPLEEWLATVSSIWDDHDRYEQLRSACRDQAAAAETAPDVVAVRFEQAVASVVRP